MGSAVEHYAIGDLVYYAGDITRPGSNSEFQLVDDRVTGKKPVTLSFAEAAALPLTSISAWEALFERLGACHWENSLKRLGIGYNVKRIF